MRVMWRYKLELNDLTRDIRLLLQCVRDLENMWHVESKVESLETKHIWW